jgi:hypothetical protein
VNLQTSFAPTQAWAREILPGVRQTAPTINASFPWVAQARALVSPGELQGLVRDLQPATKDLASVTDQSFGLIRQLDLVNLCATNVLLPTGDIPITDQFATGLPNYKEGWMAMVGLSSESSSFDGNGSYTRVQVAGGDQPIQTKSSPEGVLLGNAVLKPLGSQPVRPAKEPPKNSKVACYKNPLPNLNNAPIGGAP